MYHKTDVLGLQAFLLENFNIWAGNGSCVEEIWKGYTVKFSRVSKIILPQTILSKDLDPEYYNKDVKRLKVKARKMYSKRKLG